MKSRIWMTMLAIALVVGITVELHAEDKAIQVDKALADYQRVSGVSGTLTSIGSDTMNNIMALWLEGFTRFYPDVKHSMEGKGSGTAPPALIAGTAQLGPMSRPMKPGEVDQAEEKYGFKPTGLRVAMDALAVYVHRDNPIESLTLPQLDGIFSKTRKRGYTDISTWGEADLENVAWKNQPIRIFGRNSASGTYLYFKDNVLKKGDYKDTVKEQPGSATVVQSITEDPYAIGYSGMGYRTSGVRTIPVAKDEGETAYDATPENVASEKYPISRFLNLYVIKSPNEEPQSLVREFVKYVFSKQGQMAVAKDGFIPLTAKQATKELKKIAVSTEVQ